MKRVAFDRVLAAVDRLGRIELPKPGAGIMGFLVLKREGLNVDREIRIDGSAFAEFCQEYFSFTDEDGVLHFFYPLDYVRRSDRGWPYGNWPRGTLYTLWKHPTPLTRSGRLSARGAGQNWSWQLQPGYVEGLTEYVHADARLPLADLVAWFYRDEQLADDATLAELKQRFLDEFEITDAETDVLLARDDDGPAPFFGEDDWAPIELFHRLPRLQAPAPAPRDGRVADEGGPEREPEFEEERILSDAELITNLVRHLRETENFQVPEDLVQNFLYSLRVDRMALLVGKPGTGKTEFVRAFVRALRRSVGGNAGVHLHEVAVTEDLAEYELLGYRDLAGAYVPSELIRALHAGDSNADLYFVLLDEMNLGVVDAYAGRLISTVSNNVAVELPGRIADGWLPQDGRWLPPTGTFVVGTMNSYLEDPSRKPLSVPVKRRANPIEMPNVLEQIVASARDGEEVAQEQFDRVCRLLVRQTASRLTVRGTSLLTTGLIAKLAGAIPAEASTVLWRLSKVLAPRTEVAMTLGVLQSVLAYALASDYEATTALDVQITQKILPLLRGSDEVLADVDRQLGERYPRSRSTLERMRELAESNAGRIRPLF